jgi:ectoine hydroxylase-related dioxygenase (phytanoyl-CoA dioxygenase family)
MAADALAVDYTASDPEALAAADARARQLLDEFGCLVACRLFGAGELEPVRRDLQRLIGLRRRLAGVSEEPPPAATRRFDDGFLALVRRRESEALVLQSALRRLLPAQEIAGHPRLQRLSEALMGTRAISHSPFNNNARVWLPDEDGHLFPWHQDYPYTQDSEDGLTYWIPLHDCDDREGTLQLAPGSHKMGILPLRPTDPRADSPALGYELAEPAVLERFPRLRLPVRAGDVLVFSTLLLHAGDSNRSGRARWALQVRHGNLEHPRAVARGWPAGRVGLIPFAESHPEYVVVG